MPAKKRRQWVAVFNGAIASGKPEGTAFAMANGVAKKDCQQASVDGHECDEKCEGMPQVDEYIAPFGGAQTFADADSHIETSLAEGKVQDQMSMFHSLWNNIWRDEELSHPQKIIRGKALLEALSERIDNPPEYKEKLGLIDRVKGLFSSRIGEEEEVGESLKAASSGGPLTITKDANGNWRWMALVTNKFYDRDKEVFPESAHKEFVDHVDKTKEYPKLWMWHTPGSRIGVADFVAYADGFRIDAGTFDKGMEAIAESLARSPSPLAMSHGFEYKAGHKRKGVFYHYRTFEDSVLPAEKAANVFTAFQVEGSKEEQEMPLTDEKRAFLIQHMGEERVSALEEALPAYTKQLEQQGVGWKDFEALMGVKIEEPKPGNGDPPNNGDPPSNGDDPSTPDDGDDATGGEDDSTPSAELSPQVVDELKKITAGFATVTEKLGAIETELVGAKTRLDALEKTDDEKIANAMSPRRPAPTSDRRPSEDAKTAIPEDLAKKIFGEGASNVANDPIEPYFQDLVGGQVVKN